MRSAKFLARRGFVKNLGMGTSAFSPTDLENLQLWYDAADESTITVATGVSNWADKSGNDNHAVQATGALQPAWTQNYINGLPAVVAEDVHYLTFPALTNAYLGYTVYIVFVDNQDLSANAGGFTFYSGGPDASSLQRQPLLYFLRSANAPQMGAGAIGTTSHADNPQNTPSIFTCDYTAGGLARSWMGGSDAQTVGPGTLTASGGPGAMFVLTRGAIGEVLYYYGVHTADEKNTVLDYLSNKWGITVESIS